MRDRGSSADKHILKLENHRGNVNLSQNLSILDLRFLVSLDIWGIWSKILR